MVFSWSRRWFAAARALPREGERAAGVDAGLRAYPESDAGIVVRPPKEIVAAHGAILARLRLHAALEEDQFAGRFLAPLLRIAEHVNALPAAPYGAFAEPMGLFHAALASGFFAFQAADGRIFMGNDGVERRHALEPHWRYLCFLVGTCHPVGRALESVAVADASGADWKRHRSGLTAWVREVGAPRVFVSWAAGAVDHQIGLPAGVLPLVAGVVGPANLQMLLDASPDLVAALYRVPATGCARIAHELVAKCWQRIADLGEPRAGQPVGPQALQDLPLDQPSEPPRDNEESPEDPIPLDVRTAIHDTLKIDLLRKVVKAWHARGDNSTVMRRVEQGAAIELAFLTTQMPDVPGWVDALAREGLVHAPPQKPGLRIQKVAIVEGRPPVPALVLSNLACRRLGL